MSWPANRPNTKTWRAGLRRCSAPGLAGDQVGVEVPGGDGREGRKRAVLDREFEGVHQACADRVHWSAGGPVVVRGQGSVLRAGQGERDEHRPLVLELEVVDDRPVGEVQVGEDDRGVLLPIGRLLQGPGSTS